jgi:hypothetical protein
MLGAAIAWTALMLVGVAVVFGPGFSDPATETNVAFFVGLAGALVTWVVGLVVVAVLAIRREHRQRPT